MANDLINFQELHIIILGLDMRLCIPRLSSKILAKNSRIRTHSMLQVNGMEELRQTKTEWQFRYFFKAEIGFKSMAMVRESNHFKGGLKYNK